MLLTTTPFVKEPPKFVDFAMMIELGSLPPANRRQATYTAPETGSTATLAP